MITLSWIDSEIEKSMSGEASAKNVYDLAALLTVRAYLSAPQEPQREEKPAETVRLIDYCADLDKCPTIEQVESALGAIAVNTPAESKRAKEARIWADILRR